MSEDLLRFPYNVEAVKAIIGNTYSDDFARQGVIAIDSSWTDSPSIDMIENNPEVGPPIRRLRSTNVKHSLPISFMISNYWYNKLWLPFIRDLHGINHFLFPNITYNRIATQGSTDIEEVEAWFNLNGGQPFTVKRQDKYTYLVSANIVWVEEDGLNAR